MQLAPHFRGVDRVIVVDAIDAGDAPGSVFRFRAEEGLPMLRSHTSHGISVPELLTAARLTGSSAEVLVYAIQVADVDPMREELSPRSRRRAGTSPSRSRGSCSLDAPGVPYVPRGQSARRSSRMRVRIGSNKNTPMRTYSVVAT